MRLTAHLARNITASLSLSLGMPVLICGRISNRSQSRRMAAVRIFVSNVECWPADDQLDALILRAYRDALGIEGW